MFDSTKNQDSKLYYMNLNQMSITNSFKAPKRLVIIQKEFQVKVCKVFQILYTKDIKKKIKKRSDGIFLQEGHNVSLFDEIGKKIYAGYKNDIETIEDSEIQIGSYLVDLLKEIGYEEYQTGRCFLNNQTVQSIVMNVNKNRVVQTKLPSSQPSLVDEFSLTDPKDENIVQCKIDNFLNKQMRIHQKQGVKFLFQTVCGMKGANINGAILAVIFYLKEQDSMGLGKTLQAITLIWVLLKQNPFNSQKPFIRKVVIIAPLTLVTNWEKEINKWLGPIRLIPLIALGTKEEVQKQVKYFVNSYYECLITSYETFRNVLATQNFDKVIDLMIFDEGHRLKNMDLKIFKTISQMSCKNRIILTGTPIQNNMKEFYACCSFVNPALFQSYKLFKTIFADPIEAGLNGKTSNLSTQDTANQRSLELSNITDDMQIYFKKYFLLIYLLFLPSKFEYQIFLQMAPLQKQIYKKMIKVSETSREKVFSILNLMRKLLTHPDLLFLDQSDLSKQFISQFPPDYQSNLETNSMKIMLLKELLGKAVLKKEKLVLCSYYCQTLDIIQYYLQNWKIEYLRLDGSVPNKKRQVLIDQFSSSLNLVPVFLMNGKSGGTGLNLQAANKIILMDVDWNPANDIQVMARIWREGQTKEVHIYRPLICGTFEEKILQRQLIKERLCEKIVDEEELFKKIKNEELRDLFIFTDDKKCLTYAEDQNYLIKDGKESNLLQQTKQNFDIPCCKYFSFVKINSTIKQQIIADSDETTQVQNVVMDQNFFLNPENEASHVNEEQEETDSQDILVKDFSELTLIQMEQNDDNNHLDDDKNVNLYIDNEQNNNMTSIGCKSESQKKITFNIEDSEIVFSDSKFIPILDDSNNTFDKLC